MCMWAARIQVRCERHLSRGRFKLHTETPGAWRQQHHARLVIRVCPNLRLTVYRPTTPRCNRVTTAVLLCLHSPVLVSLRPIARRLRPTVGQGEWEDLPDTSTIGYSDKLESIAYTFTVRALWQSSPLNHPARDSGCRW